MSSFVISLFSGSDDLPQAVSALIIAALAFAFVWFLNRSVNKMDKAIEKLETTMDGFVERLIKHDNRHDNNDIRSTNIEKRIEKLEEARKPRR